eukprot:gene15988-17598_t
MDRKQGDTMVDSTRLIWVDLEMTGLDVEVDQIIEIACIVTGENLEIIEVGPDLIIKQCEEVMNNMGEWCTEQHGKSGLTKAVLESEISLKDAERVMLDFVKQHTKQGQCPLAGNSIYTDKKFLEKYMPCFANHSHYRIVDVSSVKELCKRWYPEEYENSPKKKGNHRALDDIKESINELIYYKNSIFKK